MTHIILRKTPIGPRAYPIDAKQAADLVADGKAEVMPDGVLREIDDQEYQTKDMIAEQPRRRKRQPKSRSEPVEAELGNEKAEPEE